MLFYIEMCIFVLLADEWFGGLHSFVVLLRLVKLLNVRSVCPVSMSYTLYTARSVAIMLCLTNCTRLRSMFCSAINGKHRNHAEYK